MLLVIIGIIPPQGSKIGGYAGWQDEVADIAIGPGGLGVNCRLQNAGRKMFF
jgi:hypothetical protein